MITEAPSDLHRDAFARIADIDTLGVASVAEAAGTPLYDSAVGLLPGARSVVVLGMEIFPEIIDLLASEGQMGAAAARDLYTPHVEFLNGRLNRGLYELAKVYRDAGFRAVPLPSTGTPNDPRFLRGILSFKHAAVYAGLGTIGHNSLLITPKFGPRVRLACLVTTAEIPATGRLYDDPCSSCPQGCIENCPSQALAATPVGQPYAINKFACSSYRTASGGCSTCLAVCPIGR